MTPQPITERGLDQFDVGGGIAATVYTDGSVVFWKIAPPNEEVGYLPPGGENPVDLKDGRAGILGPDGTPMAYDITNPPPEMAGVIPGGAEPGTVPAVQAPQVTPARVNPITPGGYGSRGFLPSGEPRPLNLLQGTTDFGRGPNVDIRPEYAKPLQDPVQARGYLEGSGTFNQFKLDQPGLFGTVPGQQGTVNLRYGLGGAGDPTTGREIQTPSRWITGNATDSVTPMQGDEYARGLRPLPAGEPGGRPMIGRGGGGGGFYGAGGSRYPQSYMVGALLGAPDPSSPSGGVGFGASGSGGGYDEGPGGYGGGSGGGFFGSNVTSNWGWTPETAGLDFIATLFLRSDTPTGIGTPAWSAPPQMWNALIEEIRRGRIYVKDPQAWEMLRQYNPAFTPQNIGGAATGGQNVQPGGAGGTGEQDAMANANAAEAADRAAYWAYQQSLLRQGDQRIALEAARDAWTKAYQEAGLTGTLNGQQTLAAQMQRAGLTGMFEGNPTMAREQMLFNQEMQKVANELAAAGLLGTYQGQQTLAAKAQEFTQQMQQRQFGLSEAGVTGTYNGQPTLAAQQLRDTTALGLLGLQAQMRGPRNWDAYQTTFASTPQGLRDVMGAFQGAYTLPGATGATGTAQGGRATVAGAAGDILSGTYGNAGEQPAAMGNPYQADLRNWNRMQPSQREMVLGRYENQGWYGDDVENMLRSAAPKYAGAGGANYALYR